MSHHATTPPASAGGPAAPATPRASAPRPPAWATAVGAVALVALVGGGVAYSSGQFGPDTREGLPAEARDTGRADEAVAVTAEAVACRPVQRSVEVGGTFYGFDEVTVTAKVEGRVRVVHRDVGDRVRPGDALVEIEAADYEQAVQQDERALLVELARLGLHQAPDDRFDLTRVPPVMQAQVKMETAKARMDRAHRVVASGGGSTEDRDVATGDYRSAQAEYANQVLQARAGLATVQLKQSVLAGSRLKLAETRVVAPTPTRPVPGADGGGTYAVTARGVSEGTMLRAGTEVCKLVVDRTLKLRVPVPERFGAEVRVGQAVVAAAAAFPRPVPGTVARINPAVEPTTRTFEVEVHVSNPAGAIKPGSFAKAAILTRVDADTVTVPVTAPYRFAGTTRVFVVEGGKARDVPVTLGTQTTEWVEVLGPSLPPGTQVVTSGHAVLADGTPVTVRGPQGR